MAGATSSRAGVKGHGGILAAARVIAVTISIGTGAVAVIKGPAFAGVVHRKGGGGVTRPAGHVLLGNPGKNNFHRMGVAGGIQMGSLMANSTVETIGRSRGLNISGTIIRGTRAKVSGMFAHGGRGVMAVVTVSSEPL